MISCPSLPRVSAVLASILGGAALLPATAAADLQASLGQIDDLFDGYYAWFGSMYDRQSGGAYYSAVSRANPHLYPPHIESTSKYANVLDWSGRIGQTPEAVREAIVDGYFKPRQIGDPAHAYAGFFLDADYANLDPADNGATVSDTAAARALQFSVNTIELFGGTPDHPLPDPAQGGMDHLRSGAAFTQWLEDRRWDRTWTAGGDILAQVVNIKLLAPARREEVLDAAWDYLENTQQDPATGHWGEVDRGDNRRPYILLNGDHKIVSFYTEFGRTVPHADTLLDVALAEVETHPAINLLYIYNVSQLVKNLTTASDATISDEELARFVRSEADYLARFLQDDGGFSGTLGGANASRFQPAINGPVSNTDVGGLALRARDTLHDLVNGTHEPLEAASDPRLFGMSGVNSAPIVTYDLADGSPGAETAGGVQASNYVAAGTDGHVDNDDPSYHQFTVTPAGGPMSLYFLSLHAGDAGAERARDALVTFALGGSPADDQYIEAGRTMFTGGDVGRVTRDIPLLTFTQLQDLDQAVTFRIYGGAPATGGRESGLNRVQLHAAVPEVRSR